MDMRVLINGADGFIGSHLTEDSICGQEDIFVEQ